MGRRRRTGGVASHIVAEQRPWHMAKAGGGQDRLSNHPECRVRNAAHKSKRICSQNESTDRPRKQGGMLLHSFEIAHANSYPLLYEKV